MIPFHLLAIVHDAATAAYVIAYARDHASVGFGLMLRDPLHDTGCTRLLAGSVRTMDCPANVHLITNGCSVERIDTVHLPSRFAAPEAVLPTLDASVRFGMSVHSIEDARQAQRLGTSYVAFGPIFPTPSKPGHRGQGLPALGAVCNAVHLPVFALGGIDETNVEACLEAGAYGIAALSLFTPAKRAVLDAVVAAMRLRFPDPMHGVLQ